MRIPSLTHRSLEKELIDLGPAYYSQEEYLDCQKKLFYINLFLGFFKDTKTLLKQFSNESKVLDVGCGGGLFILHLSKHFPQMKFLGLDINVEAIQNAQKQLEIWQNRGLASHVSFEINKDSLSTDILLATLVCHHMTDQELIIFLQQAHQNAKEIVIINDLHRHVVAQWFYRILSPILFRNRLITHDGLISIRRGFTRHEWQTLLKMANITNYQIQWRWPFRWRVTLWK